MKVLPPRPTAIAFSRLPRRTAVNRQPPAGIGLPNQDRPAGGERRQRRGQSAAPVLPAGIRCSDVEEQHGLGARRHRIRSASPVSDLDRPRRARARQPRDSRAQLDADQADRIEAVRRASPATALGRLRRAWTSTASVRPWPQPTSTSVPPLAGHPADRRAIDRIAAELSPRELPRDESRAADTVRWRAPRAPRACRAAPSWRRHVATAASPRGRCRQSRCPPAGQRRRPRRWCGGSSRATVVKVVAAAPTRRSGSPTSTSSGENSGLEMLAARYILKRFRCSSQPTNHTRSRWNP